MVSALAYLINCCFYRLAEFVRRWYSGGFLFFSRRLVDVLERWDRFFALKISCRYLFQPLYQNYTFLGYLLGFIFRSARILIAGVVYGLLILAGISLYLGWALIPVFVLFRIFY